ncbi:MAG: CDP-alcohol phosphatidyltransferase family protein [Deltaproteobacteria bacterium]|nr:CDP-alcohol phosphatidyltransferase family protein [Deltaproteobacteria bacterium]
MKLTANHVTLLRIFLLPIPSGMILFGEDSWMWAVFALGFFLAATDFIDGYMARRDGPTVLGGLLDPTADKLFVASLILPFAAKGIMPWWLAACIFTRELLITALRSSLALRNEHLTTSKLAKTKTVAQMGGLGVFFAMWISSHEVAVWINGILVLLFTAILLGFLLRRKEVPFWLWGAVVMWWPAFLGIYFLDKLPAALVIFIIMAGLTVASGIDYLIGAAKIFQVQGLRRHDMTRVFWALSHGIGSMWLVERYPVTVIPLMLSLSAELCYGGIDNILTAEKGHPPKGTFIFSGVLSLMVLGATLAAYTKEHKELLVISASVLAVVGFINAGRAFFAEWDFFKTAA